MLTARTTVLNTVVILVQKAYKARKRKEKFKLLLQQICSSKKKCSNSKLNTVNNKDF